MKKIIIIIIVSSISFHSFSQRTDSIPQLNKEDYLLKSKRQKTTGKIILGSGALITGIGLITSLGQGLNNLFTAEQDRSNSGDAITIAGLIVMGSSIPFFIASSSSKKKAMGISFKNEKALLINNNGFSYIPVPSLNLKIRL